MRRRRRRFPSALLVALLLPALSAANEASAPFPTLDGLLRSALESSRAIAADGAEMERASFLAAAADRLPDPKLGIYYSPVAVETRGGPQRVRASAEQTFPFMGKRGLRRDVAESTALIAGHRKERTAASVILDVKTAFWEIYGIDRSMETAEEEARLVADIAASVEAKYATGSGNQAHLLQAQLMQTEIANRLILLGGDRDGRVERLSGIIGRAAAVPFLAEAEWSPFTPDRERLTEAAMRENPEAETSREKERRARFALDLARKDFFPDFALSVGWGEIGESDLPGEWSGRDTWTVGAALKLPLHRGDLRDRERASLAGLRAAEEERAETLLRIGAVAEEAVDRILSTGRSIELYRNGLIPQAESAFESAVAAYSTGEFDFADLILAEKSLLYTRLRFHESIARQYRLIARLDFLVGSKDKESLFLLRNGGWAPGSGKE